MWFTWWVGTVAAGRIYRDVSESTIIHDSGFAACETAYVDSEPSFAYVLTAKDLRQEELMSQYTHIFVGVQDPQDTYVIAAVDDIHVALTMSSKAHGEAPVFWYLWDHHAFGFAPSQRIQVKLNDSAWYDFSEDCEFRLSWALDRYSGSHHAGRYAKWQSYGRFACSHMYSGFESLQRSESDFSVRRVVKYCTKKVVKVPPGVTRSKIVGKIFVQENEVEKGFKCQLVYTDDVRTRFPLKVLVNSRKFTHILVGVVSRSTYVVAALDDINVALTKTSSYYRAQRGNPHSPVFWYNTDVAFGFSPTSHVYLVGCRRNRPGDNYGYINWTNADCGKRLTWSLHCDSHWLGCPGTSRYYSEDFRKVVKYCNKRHA